MNAAGITRRLLNVAEVLVGHMTGALAQMCVVLATMLGGLTASSNADAAILSKTIGLEMTKHGYSRAFAAVITSSSSIIAALIPPSIGLIIYGYLTETSVGRLFAGGVVPGLLLAAGLMTDDLFRRGSAWLQGAAQGPGQRQGGSHCPARWFLGYFHSGCDPDGNALRHFSTD